MCRGVKRGGQLRRRRRYQGQPGHSVPVAGSSCAHPAHVGAHNVCMLTGVCSSRDEAVCTLYHAWICSTTQPLLGDHNIAVTTMLPQS